MSENKEKILAISDLDITFKTTAGPVHAIRGINIDLYKGETVAIVGESGSGKSVTMKAAMGNSCLQRRGKRRKDRIQLSSCGWYTGDRRYFTKR